MIRRSIAAVLAGMAVVAYAEEQDLRSRFERVRDIDGAFDRGQCGRLLIPSDVFGQAHDFPADLRVLDANGIQWPHFVHTQSQKEHRETLAPKILSPSFVQGSNPYLQFDLVIPGNGDSAPTHNQMELITSGRDFIRRVEVFSDGERDARGLMAAGHLIRFSQQRNARNRLIRYPDSDASRLHVRIYSNAQNIDETFSLNSATVFCSATADAERETVPATDLPLPKREVDESAQTRLFDLGFENRPVDAVVFEIENALFARSISVYGRNSGNAPWNWVGGGEIHVLEGDRQLKVELSRSRYRFIKVQIFHNDDLPLEVASVRLEADPCYLIFEAATPGAAALYYRAWNLRPAKYDLKERITPERIETIPRALLLAARSNDIADVHPLRKYTRLIAIVVVGAVSLLVIWIIVSMLRQQHREE